MSAEPAIDSTWRVVSPQAPSFSERLRQVVQDGVLVGVKWLIVSLFALFGVGWALNDYAFVRDQARYVALVRQQQAQQTAPARPAPAPKPSTPVVP